MPFSSQSEADYQAIPSRFPSPEPAIPAEPAPNVLPSFEGENGGNGDVFHLNHINAGLFDTELDVGSFNLDGFWEDFTLTDSGGFPFR